MFILVCYQYLKKRHFLYKYQLENFTVSSIIIYPRGMKTIFNDGERVFGKEQIDYQATSVQRISFKTEDAQMFKNTFMC